MPNWCDCDLSVRLPYEKANKEKANKEEGIKELKRFQEFAKTENGILDVDKFIPYPQEFKKLDKKAKEYQEKLKTLPEEIKKDMPYWIKDGFNSGGHQWCIENWGTKWGICNAELENADYASADSILYELEYTFDTAWSPPTPVVKKMSEMFPSLTFTLKYFDGSMGFNGRYTCKNGEVIENLSGDYFGDRGG